MALTLHPAKSDFFPARNPVSKIRQKSRSAFLEISRRTGLIWTHVHENFKFWAGDLPCLELQYPQNTLIIFTSDNGPTYNGGTDSQWFDGAGPFSEDGERIKGHVYEGGIRVPMIASWPGKIAPGTSSDLISSPIDMMATFAEITGFEVPENDGISILPTLLGKVGQEKHEYLYWEFPESGGQVAIRFGDWKLIRQHLKDKEPPTLERYNLREDPLETNNVAEANPEILAQAETIFAKAHQPSELERFRIPLLEKGLLGMEEAS